MTSKQKIIEKEKRKTNQKTYLLLDYRGRDRVGEAERIRKK